MEVKYNPPTRERGRFVFKEPLKDMSYSMSDFIRVSSLDDCLARQTRILDATQHAVDYLRHRELPAGVDGNVEVMFRLWVANRSILGLGIVGELGFPDFSIQTTYGHSSFYLWPREGGGEVNVYGSGIAQEVVKALQSDFEQAFKVPDSQLLTFGSHVSHISLTDKLILPKPRF